MESEDTHLRSSETSSKPALAAMPSASEDEADGSSIRVFDFRQPSFLTAPEMRKLRECHQEFVAAAAARLTSFFRFQVELTLAGMEPKNVGGFIKSLATPTHLTLFKLDPWRGTCVCEMGLELSLIMADRLMGGAGEGIFDERGLSEIEASLLDRVVLILTETWAEQWAKCQTCQPALLGHEDNPHYLQLSAADANALVVTVQATLEEATGTIQMVFPLRTLEPVLRHVREELQATAGTPNDRAEVKPVRWNKRLEEVPLALDAVLPAVKLRARQLSKFQVGDVLPLPVGHAECVELRLANRAKFFGRLGKREDHWAVEVTQVVKPDFSSV